MTAANHALTGTLIGLVSGRAEVALPAALLSHFICDALPHWTPEILPEKRLKTKGFRNYLMAEATFCFLVVLVLAVVRPEHWLLACVCAFLAASPDLLWIPRYLKTRAGKRWRPSAYSRFAQAIQWFTKPIGAGVEIAWAAGCLVLILPFLR